MPRPASPCPACSAPNPANARFCSSCGKALGGSGSPDASPGRGGRWRRRLGLGVAGLVALCVGLAALGSVLDGGDDDDRNASTDRPTREVAALNAEGPGTPVSTVPVEPPTATASPTEAAVTTAAPTGTATRATATTAPTPTPTVTSVAVAGPTATKASVLVAGDVEVRVTGATLAPSFGPPLALDPLDDGRSYLLVTVEIHNVGGDDERLDSDHFRLVVNGEEVKEATDVVDDAKGPLGLRSMGDRAGTQVDAGDRAVFLLAYKVDPAAPGYVLFIDKGAAARVDLAPWLGEGIAVEALAPTATPEPTATATPVPTRTPIPTATPAPPDGVPDGAVLAEVVGVVDGDTITVEVGGEEATVRLTGIDTPETVDPDTADECYGAEASAFAIRLLDGRTVWLEADVDRTDRDDRWLRYVWLLPRDGSDPYLANVHLVREGYAVVSTVPPNVRHVDALTDAQDAAVKAYAGLWASCGGADTPLAPTPRPTRVPARATATATQAAVVTSCDPFVNFAEAQIYYRANPDAQPYLDPNNDGRACEFHFQVDAPVAPAPNPAQGIVADPAGAGYAFPAGDVDCPEISYDYANWLLDQDPSDPYRLDANNNGEACER